MNEYQSRHYSRAPITEAIIEIQCELPPATAMLNLLSVHERIKPDYPERAEQHAFQAQFTIGSGPSATQSVIGYRLASQDGKRIVQVRPNTFAFSQLAPYDKWETVRAEALRLWEIYRETVSPVRITRVGVRYINRVDVPSQLPGGGIDLDDYFQTAPRIAPSLPQTMTNYFMRIQLPLEETGASAVITQTGVPPPSPGLVSTVLDIDVFIEGGNLDEGSAWNRIDFLRHQKNRFFEACITDRVRELIR